MPPSPDRLFGYAKAPQAAGARGFAPNLVRPMDLLVNMMIQTQLTECRQTCTKLLCKTFFETWELLRFETADSY